MTPSDLDALERLAQKATPGPWRTDTMVLIARATDDGAGVYEGDHIATFRYPDVKYDANYIAACDQTTILALVALARKGMEAK